MQIRTRLTLLFTLLVAAILAVFAMAIYFTSSQTREEEYYKRMKQQAETKANLLFDSKVAPNVLQVIYKNAPNTLFQEEVAIYDTAFHLLYHDAVDVDKVKETKGMIDSIVSLKEIRFYLKDIQVIGFLYAHNGNNYVITAAAIDEAGFAKLRDLRNTLIVALIIALVIVFFVGEFLAKKSLEPVTDLLANINNIKANNLNQRVPEGNRKDEIASLAISFNQMLDRIETSFDAQKDFVSNISHELRTPLTAILTELQLVIQKERTTEAYKSSINHAIVDVKKLIRLSNGLLDMAKANYDQTEIGFKAIRIDEVLLDAMNDVMHNQPEYKVNITFDQEIENDDLISAKANEYLLKTAFINLIENGCKFSADKLCSVHIGFDSKNILLQFSDNGVGISKEDLENLFKPFYRGANKRIAEGNGIGLSITQKIIHLHNGHIQVNSVLQKGTTFAVILPHI